MPVGAPLMVEVSVSTLVKLAVKLSAVPTLPLTLWVTPTGAAGLVTVTV